MHRLSRRRQCVNDEGHTANEKISDQSYDHEAQHLALSSSPFRFFTLRHAIWLMATLVVIVLIRGNGESRVDRAFDPFAHIPQPDPTDRLTVYATWTGSTYKEYLRHFIYSARQNADMLDVVLVNRKGADGACIDFESNAVYLPEGSNFRHICLDDREWTRKHANFTCAMWSCTGQEYDKVWRQFDERLRHDHKNSEFHPFLGQVFSEYNPSRTPYWAWTDVDMILGRMSDFPFNILSTVSFLITSNTRNLFMHGQFTAFNANDQDLASAWMREADFVSPAAFIASDTVLGEEHYWSRAYLRSTDGHAGTRLSWAAVPYRVTSDRAARNQTILISGRDVLLVNESSTITKIDVRAILQSSRTRHLDGGVDIITTYEDFDMAKSYWWATAHDDFFREGIETIEWLSTIEMKKGYECICNHFIPVEHTQCLPQHVIELIAPTLVRPSYLRLKQSGPGLVFRRYDIPLDSIVERESDEGYEITKKYSKVAFVHFLLLKHHANFPTFDIDAGTYMLIKPSGIIEVHELLGQESEAPIFTSGHR